MEAKQYTHYIAIDFGTAGCGIAVSTSVGNKEWMYRGWLPSGPSGPQKCPTIMLLDHNGECEEFGKKDLLKNYYKGIVNHRDKISEYYLFQYFKMNLYEEKNISKDLMITAMNGKTLPAITVFTKALQYMRRLVLEELDNQVANPFRSILWILTVPAIWSHAARQVMRIAAKQAGFETESDSLTLALEPEAASLYCIEIDELMQSSSNSTNCHMIVDCGGGTVDIAVHRWERNTVNKTVYVDEVHKVHGGPCGSFAVNKNFEMFLKELLQISHSEILTSFEQQWYKLVYNDFEQTKCSFSPTDRTIMVVIPEKICEYIETTKNTSVEELVNSYPNGSLEWDEEEGGIAIPHDVMQGFFKPVFDQIIHHIDFVLKAPECNKSVTKIILVGGFAVSNDLKDEVCKHFPNYTVERGQNPWLSVLFGAIKFGKNHNIMRSRIMRQTIGIETWDIFVPGYHNEKYKKEVEGKSLCTKIFTKFFEVNERISADNLGKELTAKPASDECGDCAIKIYSSYDAGTKYIDDISCFVLGTLVVEGIPGPQSNLSREIKIRIDATGPQISVTAKNNGNNKELKLNLLK